MCNWSDSLHTGAVPKTAHNKLLIPKKTNWKPVKLCTCAPLPVLFSFPSCGAPCWYLVPVRLCALCPATVFCSSSSAPFQWGALLCCLRPLVVLARLVLLGLFFLGMATTQNRSLFAGTPFASCYSCMTLGRRILSIGLEWDIELYDRLLVHEVTRVCDQVASVPLVVMWRTSFCTFPR